MAATSRSWAWAKMHRIRLYLRTMDSLEVRPLEGSEVAPHAPPFFWSPDSRFIAFDAGGVLKKLNIAGGPAQTFVRIDGSGDRRIVESPGRHHSWQRGRRPAACLSECGGAVSRRRRPSIPREKKIGRIFDVPAGRTSLHLSPGIAWHAEFERHLHRDAGCGARGARRAAADAVCDRGDLRPIPGGGSRAVALRSRKAA